ncbi:MAG: hypothetical protein ACRDJ5_05490 [Actinomycetota bacterium]
MVTAPSLRRLAPLVAVSLLFLGCSSQAPPDAAPPGGDEARRKPPRLAPDRDGKPTRSQPVKLEHDFAVTTFSGQTFRLSEHAGTPVVVNFWESW